MFFGIEEDPMQQVSRILIAALVFFAMADSSFGADKRDDLEKITFYVG